MCRFAIEGLFGKDRTMNTQSSFPGVLVGLAILICSMMVLAEPMGTAFTYQGRLLDGNAEAHNLSDCQFKVFEDATGVTQVGSDGVLADVNVIDGYFMVELDFGSGVFDGQARWLEIGVRPGDQNDLDPYTLLTPLQKILPAPYAVYAETCGSGGGGVSVPLELSGSVATPDAIIRGINTSGYGVYGANSGSGNYGYLGSIDYGVYGRSENDFGVYGRSDTSYGVYGRTEGGTAVQGYNVGSGNYGKLATNDYGVYGDGSLYGVYGLHSSGNYGYIADSDYGVYGEEYSSGNYGSLGASTYGVYGYSNTHYGVYGSSGTGRGVRGQSVEDYGVHGTSNNSTGVYGYSDNQYGVYGLHSNGNYGYLGGPYGVHGYGYNCGVYGSSVYGYGVYGESTASGDYGYLGYQNCGVYGWNSGNGYGVYGGSAAAGYAAYFEGQAYFSGNVGINTESPTQKLDVMGTVKATSFIGNGSGLTNISYTETDPQVGGNAANYVPKWNGSALVTGTIYDNGNIGIGVSGPTYKLDVSGNVRATQFVDSANTAYYLDPANSTISATFASNVGIGTTNPLIDLAIGDTDTGLQQQGDGQLAFYTNNVERVRIDTAGRVGIGKTPSYTLDIVGNRVQVADSTGDWIAMRTDGGSADYLDLSYGGGSLAIQGSSSSEDIVLNPASGAKVGVGTWAPSRKFFVSGDAGGTTAWSNDSDARLKKDIVTISDALQKVLELRGVEFEWKDTENHPEGKQIGFIGQETAGIVPEVVEVKDGQYSMQYAPLTALLVEAVKEQQAQIETLQAEVRALRKRIEVQE